MAYNYNEKTNTSNFLIPFTIANDCPHENREIIYRIIINLKNNFFKETKHIQQINIHRNHLVHYLPVILLDRDQYNKHYTFTLTDEKRNKKIFFNFQNETSLSDMLKIFLKRPEESQDKTKLTAVTSTTYETLRNTAGYLNEHRQQKQSVTDKLRLDIKNYNNWLTKIIEIKPDLKTTTLDIIKIVSEFTFLFWLDNLFVNVCMCLYVLMCTYVSATFFVSVYVCLSVNGCMWVCVCLSLCVCTICRFVCVCVCKGVCVCVCLCLCMRAYICLCMCLCTNVKGCTCVFLYVLLSVWATVYVRVSLYV